MARNNDPFLHLFPPVLEKVLANLTFDERCITLSTRSDDWKSICMYKLHHLSLIPHDMHGVRRSLGLRKRHPNVEEVVLKHVINMLPKRQSIHSLSISSMYVQPFFEWFKGKTDHICPSIQSLKYHIDHNEDVGLSNMCTNLPNLDKLSIYGSNRAYSPPILQSLHMCSSELHQLSINKINIPRGSLGNVFRKCMKLKILKLKHLRGTIDVIIPVHIQLHKLFVNEVKIATIDVETQKEMQLLHYDTDEILQGANILDQMQGSTNTLSSLALCVTIGTGQMRMLSGFPMLRHLYIHDLYLEDTWDLTLLSEIGLCKSIETLELEGHIEHVEDHEVLYDLLNSLKCLNTFIFNCYGNDVPWQKERFLSRGKALYIRDVYNDHAFIVEASEVANS